MKQFLHFGDPVRRHIGNGPDIVAPFLQQKGENDSLSSTRDTVLWKAVGFF